jgi:hypothetical protein
MSSSNPKKLIYFIIVASVISGVISSYSYGSWSGLAIGITVYTMLQFVNNLGNTIPIRYLIVFLACIQWLFGPVLAYAGYSNHYKYYMYVPIEEYMPFAISGVFALFIGLWIFKIKKERELYGLINEIKPRIKQDGFLGYKLIALGWISSLIQSYMPGSLQFIFFLLGNVMYVGILYLILQPSVAKWWVTALIFFLMFLSSMQSAMFHGLLLWLTFLAFYVIAIKQFSFIRKLQIVALGIFLSFVFQVVKWEIRNGNTLEGSLSTFWYVLDNKIINQSDPDEAASSTENMVVRMNQGWIISRIMYYIPEQSPYLDGESVNGALYASLLPRFIASGKSVAGGKEYFYRFTGFELGAATSMGPSLIGEGYANYGYVGALVFLFLFGVFVSFILSRLYKLANNYPTLILWLPLIFLQVVKAESDLARVLNHLTKAAFLVFLLYWFLGRVLKWKI